MVELDGHDQQGTHHFYSWVYGTKASDDLYFVTMPS